MDIGLLLLVFLGVLIVFTIMRNTRHQRDIRRLQETLEPGIKVATSSGMLGTVVSIDDEGVTLESTPGHRSRWVRAAIARVIETPEHTPADGESAGHDGADRDGDQDEDAPAGRAGEAEDGDAIPDGPTSRR